MDEKYLATGTWPEAIEMPGKAITMQENAWRPGRPAGGAYSAPPDALAGGEGAGCPLLKNPSPALGPSGLACPRPLILNPP